MWALGLVWAHKQQIHIFPTFFLIPKDCEDAKENLQSSGPDRLGGGRGRVNPPPWGLFGGFRVWRVCCLVSASLSECLYTPRGQRPRRIAETFQKAMFLVFESPKTKTQKLPNTEPQGVPEALERFGGKIIQFSITWMHRQWLKLIREECF